MKWLLIGAGLITGYVLMSPDFWDYYEKTWRKQKDLTPDQRRLVFEAEQVIDQRWEAWEKKLISKENDG